MNKINGVIVKKLRVIPDERGRLIEILRQDEEIFKNFGQIYLTTVYKGVVKAWHYHKKQTDNIVCISGMIKLVLFDNRKKSRTYKNLMELFIGQQNLSLVHIPPNVLHGFKGVYKEESMIINIPDKVYDYKKPDEYRLAFNSKAIGYNWERKNF